MSYDTTANITINPYVLTLATAYDSAGRAATFTSAGEQLAVTTITRGGTGNLTATVTVPAGHSYYNGTSVIITGAS